MQDIDKSKSISNMTMKELRMFVERLRTEQSAESLMMELNRNAERKTYDGFGVDTITPVGQLYHHGVLGMKWGIRKEHLSLKTKSGDEITLSEQPSTRLISFLGKHSKRVAAEQEKTAIFNIKDPKGKTVGDITLYKESPDSINVVWVTTDQSVRGKGYGSAVMKSAISIAKETGAKQVTLEVPGTSPDAKHIYEKLGFKSMPSPEKDEDDIWGGLTNMKLDLKTIKHSSLSPKSLTPVSQKLASNFLNQLVKEIDNLPNEDKDDKDDKELTHHGILGMKWGVRKKSSSSTTPTLKEKNKQVKKQRKKVSAVRRHLSDAEIKKAVERLQMEKKLKELTAEDVSQGKSTAKKILGQIGKTTATAVGTAVATYAVKAAMQGNFDIKEAAKFIIPKKK